MAREGEFELSCPLPLSDYPQVLLAHGGGGRLMQQLIRRLIAPALENPQLDVVHDAAVLEAGGARLAFTTDSYVVKPLIFPGGDIGSLAVNGTVNDLAMSGAKPLYLSCGLILEEGLAMETLWRVLTSMRETALEAGAHLVTGDTKVVDRGKGDGVFINTAGVGLLEHPLSIGPGSVRAGDAVLLSGDVGRHGMAIMAQREGLAFETTIESDCAPLWEPVKLLLDAGLDVHCLRDLTRGGLASALIEIASAAALHLELEERAIPVREEVQGACEILGLDPLYVANEGRFVAFIPGAEAEHARELLRGHPLGADACLIGRVVAEPDGMVTIESKIGASRILDLLSGEQLPRIC